MDDVTSQLPPAELAEVLDWTDGAVWQELADARVLLTGATGFWGVWLVESLLAADRRWALNLELVATTRSLARLRTALPHLAAEPRMRWLELDPTSPAALPALQAAVARSAKRTLLAHFATEADNARAVADPAGATAVIVDGAANALAWAEAAGAERVLLGSSGSVYGPPVPGAADPTEAAVPAWTEQPGGVEAYAITGWAKWKAEQAGWAWGARCGAAVVAARGFAFAGPRLPVDGKFAWGNFLADALAGRDIVIQGDGTPERSYLYGADLAVWLLTLLALGRGGNAYNVGSDRAVSIAGLAEVMRREVAPQVRVQVRGVADPARPVSRYVPDLRRAKQELGLVERVDLAGAVRRHAAWLRGRARH